MRSLLFLLAASGCGRVGFGLFDDSAPIDADAGPADLTSDLVAWFELDETSGTLATDSSPAGHPGFVLGGAQSTWQPGRVGGGLDLDNTNPTMSAFLTFPSTNGLCAGQLTLTSSITASAWVRAETAEDWGNYSLSAIAIMLGANGGTQGGWGVGLTNACGALTVGMTVTPSGNESVRATRCGATPVALGTWHHVAGVYDAAARTIEVYVDGVRDSAAFAPGSEPVPSALFAPDACPHVGSGSNQYNMLNGMIDEARIYARALTTDEIAALFIASGG